MTDPAATLALLLDQVIDGATARPDAETTAAILEEARSFAEARLAPLASVADREGCRLEDGRVRTAPGHAAAWAEFAGAGWAGLTAAEDAGGQGLPLALATAVQEVFDAANPGFGMLALNARCAIRLLERHGDPGMRETWLPALAAGRWGATICISEAQAGSDVGRIRTRAVDQGDGTWRLSGEKCWISYGHHDLVERIGHFVLARMPGAPAGTRGLSLFLVPDRLEGGGRNGVEVLRIEEKLGLHGSPTCSLAFEEARAWPVGPAGRGLPTLFAMIQAMRLGVAAQGAAVAQAAAALAETYARERFQGGDPALPPVPITRHAETRRLLLDMRVRAEGARLLALQAASWLDAGDAGDAEAAARAAMLLPLAKSLGAEAGFANADAAIQVLGGAGYVREWPAERLLRDSRVFSIYEGTTAIQAQDLLHRRVLAEGGLFVLRDLLARLEPSATLSSPVLEMAAALAEAPARRREAAALPFLRLLGLACLDGLLHRAGRRAAPLAGRYQALAGFHAAMAPEQATLLAAQCRRDDLDAAFDLAFPEAELPP
ncbi:acyl-CoA dehydrogenase family protein [Roseomonas gilardii]|uniref:acyl-CoA dehydrogenase family protein n=1 Tax=Roseomonas gilardii TaxID=257708 RepID=UPI0024A75852|nr:acyl-CoA dehydrogenase family protein [Roseomonas gilardii]